VSAFDTTIAWYLENNDPLIFFIMNEKDPYHGQQKCAAITARGKSCTNGAYYSDRNNYFCGLHSNKQTRRELVKNTEFVKQQRNKEHETHLLTLDYDEHHIRRFMVSKRLPRGKRQPYETGYLNIFPNYKDEHRTEGEGYPSLSPMCLGPIDHGFPGLPPANNLENAHQYSKFWSFELDDKDQVKADMLEIRNRGYLSTNPKRHKWTKEVLEKYGSVVPKFSLYYDKWGNERRYSYIECRYFYCYWYTLLVTGWSPDGAYVVSPCSKAREDFRKLQNKTADLNIVGPDGYPITTDIWQCYIDTTKPFGHELVLYSLLTIGTNLRLPWERYRQQHCNIYKDVDFWFKHNRIEPNIHSVD
jgi:hypothetical protein